MVTYFENLTAGLHVLYTHVKFCVNWMLFTIQSINLFSMHNFRYKNLKFKHLIDDIAIDFLFFGNFASMEDTKRKCYLIVDLSKFTSNKNILFGVVAISQTLSIL